MIIGPNRSKIGIMRISHVLLAFSSQFKSSIMQHFSQMLHRHHTSFIIGRGSVLQKSGESAIPYRLLRQWFRMLDKLCHGVYFTSPYKKSSSQLSECSNEWMPAPYYNIFSTNDIWRGWWQQSRYHFRKRESAETVLGVLIYHSLGHDRQIALHGHWEDFCALAFPFYLLVYMACSGVTMQVLWYLFTVQ